MIDVYAGWHSKIIDRIDRLVRTGSAGQLPDRSTVEDAIQSVRTDLIPLSVQASPRWNQFWMSSIVPYLRSTYSWKDIDTAPLTVSTIEELVGVLEPGQIWKDTPRDNAPWDHDPYFYVFPGAELDPVAHFNDDIRHIKNAVWSKTYAPENLPLPHAEIPAVVAPDFFPFTLIGNFDVVKKLAWKDIETGLGIGDVVATPDELLKVITPGQSWHTSTPQSSISHPDIILTYQSLDIRISHTGNVLSIDGAEWSRSDRPNEDFLGDHRISPGTILVNVTEDFPMTLVHTWDARPRWMYAVSKLAWKDIDTNLPMGTEVKNLDELMSVIAPGQIWEDLHSTGGIRSVMRYLITLPGVAIASPSEYHRTNYQYLANAYWQETAAPPSLAPAEEEEATVATSFFPMRLIKTFDTTKLETLGSKLAWRDMEEDTRTPEQVYRDDQNACGIFTGDTVRVTRTAENYENGWDNTWVDIMDDTVGHTLRVLEIAHGSRGLMLGIGDGFYAAYPYFVLEKVDAPERTASAFIRDIVIADLPKDVLKEIKRFIPDPEGTAVLYGMTLSELLPKADVYNLDQARGNVKDLSDEDRDKYFKQKETKYILLINDRIVDGHHFLAKAEKFKDTSSLQVLDLTPVRVQPPGEEKLSWKDMEIISVPEHFPTGWTPIDSAATAEEWYTKLAPNQIWWMDTARPRAKWFVTGPQFELIGYEDRFSVIYADYYRGVFKPEQDVNGGADEDKQRTFGRPSERLRYLVEKQPVTAAVEKISWKDIQEDKPTKDTPEEFVGWLIVTKYRGRDEDLWYTVVAECRAEERLYGIWEDTEEQALAAFSSYTPDTGTWMFASEVLPIRFIGTSKLSWKDIQIDPFGPGARVRITNSRQLYARNIPFWDRYVVGANIQTDVAYIPNWSDNKLLDGCEGAIITKGRNGDRIVYAITLDDYPGHGVLIEGRGLDFLEDSNRGSIESSQKLSWRHIEVDPTAIGARVRIKDAREIYDAYDDWTPEEAGLIPFVYSPRWRSTRETREDYTQTQDQEGVIIAKGKHGYRGLNNNMLYGIQLDAYPDDHVIAGNTALEFLDTDPDRATLPSQERLSWKDVKMLGDNSQRAAHPDAYERTGKLIELLRQNGFNQASGMSSATGIFRTARGYQLILEDIHGETEADARTKAVAAHTQIKTLLQDNGYSDVEVKLGRMSFDWSDTGDAEEDDPLKRQVDIRLLVPFVEGKPVQRQTGGRALYPAAKELTRKVIQYLQAQHLCADENNINTTAAASGYRIQVLALPAGEAAQELKLQAIRDALAVSRRFRMCTVSRAANPSSYRFNARTRDRSGNRQMIAIVTVPYNAGVTASMVTVSKKPPKVKKAIRKQLMAKHHKNLKKLS